MQKIKSLFAHLWQNKKFYAVIGILLFLVYRLAAANYKVDFAVRGAEAESYMEVWNDRALCLSRYDQVKEIADGFRDQENQFGD